MYNDVEFNVCKYQQVTRREDSILGQAHLIRITSWIHTITAQRNKNTFAIASR